VRVKRRIRQVIVGIVLISAAYLLLIAPPVHRQRDAWGIRLIAGIVLFYGMLIEPNRVKVTRYCVTIPRLPTQLEGLTILQLTDIHWGGIGVNRWRLGRTVRRALAMNPDLVCITGDFIARQPRFVDQVVELLRPLGALHTYAVLGNHDRHAIQELKAALGAADIRVLDNEAVWHSCGGCELAIVGVADPSSSGDRLAEALVGVASSAEVTLLLAHSPDIASALTDQTVDLALTGHTHGVQLPWRIAKTLVRPSRDGRRYAAGWFAVGGSRLYVNRGLWHLWPFRLCCPPEIAEFTLTTNAHTRALSSSSTLFRTRQNTFPSRQK